MQTILERVTEVVKSHDSMRVEQEDDGIYVVIPRHDGEDHHLFQRRVMNMRTDLASEGIAVIRGIALDHDEAALAVTSVD